MTAVMTTDQWINLAGLLVSALGPITVFSLAVFANKRLKKFEKNIESKQKISDKRFDLYKEIGFQLNDVYAYFAFVGHWKDYSAVEIVERKRQLDRHIHTYRPVFSDEFNKRYSDFIENCFATFGGWGKDARLRTSSRHRAEDGDKKSAECFTGENNIAAIRNSYQALIDALARDLGMAAGDL
jgi:hypothetical protein